MAMVLPSAAEVTEQDSLLAKQFRRGLLKLGVLCVLGTIYAVAHEIIPWHVVLALWHSTRWLLGTVVAIRLLGPLVTLALCRWRPRHNAPRLGGRVAVVTGASAGVGRQSALQLAQLGCTVILGCRSEQRGKAAELELQRLAREAWQKTGGITLACGRVEFIQLDLADLSSVRAFAKTVATKYPRVDLLVNNGGLNAFGPRRATKDGFEEVFGVNYLGHFLLTQLLLPSLRASAVRHNEQGLAGVSRGFCGPRIVSLSSVMHRHATAAELLGFMKQAAGMGVASAAFKVLGGSGAATPTAGSERSGDGLPDSTYGASKLAMVAMTAELERRLVKETGGEVGAVGGCRVSAVSVNPGAVNSEIWRSLPLWAWYGRWAIGSLFFLSPEDGAATTLFAGTAYPSDGWVR